MPKSKCNHDYQYELHLSRHRRDKELTYILGNATLINICKLCEHEKYEMVSGGVICGEGFNTAGENTLQRLFRLQSARKSIVQRLDYM